MQQVLILDRDSVCAGDDMHTHRKILRVDQSLTLMQLWERLLVDYPLPGIGGGEACWLMRLPEQRQVCAVVAQQWPYPKWLLPPQQCFADAYGATDLTIHFDYLAQQDPLQVWARHKP